MLLRKELQKPQRNFDSVLLLLSKIETTHHLPDAFRLFQVLCHACLTTMVVLDAKRSAVAHNHKRSCTFPGLLHVNSPSTRNYTHVSANNTHVRKRLNLRHSKCGSLKLKKQQVCEAMSFARYFMTQTQRFPIFLKKKKVFSLVSLCSSRSALWKHPGSIILLSGEIIISNRKHAEQNRYKRKEGGASFCIIVELLQVFCIICVM